MNTTDWFVFIQQEHYFSPKWFAGLLWLLRKEWRLPNNFKNFIKFQNSKINKKNKKNLKVQNFQNISIFQNFQKISKW